MKLFLACLCMGAALSAAPVVQVRILDAGHPLEDDGFNYVGPYDVAIDGRPVAALCIDLADQSDVGDEWFANESNLSGSLRASYHPRERVKYEEEAFLFSEILLPGADRVALQQAAWGLFDPAYAVHGAARSWMVAAAKEYGKIDPSQFEIVSQMAGHRGARRQELLTLAMPEPDLINLFGGLIAIGLVLLSRKRG